MYRRFVQLERNEPEVYYFLHTLLEVENELLSFKSESEA